VAKDLWRNVFLRHQGDHLAQEQTGEFAGAGAELENPHRILRRNLRDSFSGVAHAVVNEGRNDSGINFGDQWIAGDVAGNVVLSPGLKAATGIEIVLQAPKD